MMPQNSVAPEIGPPRSNKSSEMEISKKSPFNDLASIPSIDVFTLARILSLVKLQKRSCIARDVNFDKKKLNSKFGSCASVQNISSHSSDSDSGNNNALDASTQVWRKRDKLNWGEGDLSNCAKSDFEAAEDEIPRKRNKLAHRDKKFDFNVSMPNVGEAPFSAPAQEFIFGSKNADDVFNFEIINPVQEVSRNVDDQCSNCSKGLEFYAQNPKNSQKLLKSEKFVSPEITWKNNSASMNDDKINFKKNSHSLFLPVNGTTVFPSSTSSIHVPDLSSASSATPLMGRSLSPSVIMNDPVEINAVTSLGADVMVNGCTDVLIIDCRSFIAFNSGHILSAQNVNFPSLLQRRFRRKMPTNIAVTSDVVANIKSSKKPSYPSTIALENVITCSSVRQKLMSGGFDVIVVYDDSQMTNKDFSSKNNSALFDTNSFKTKVDTNSESYGQELKIVLESLWSFLPPEQTSKLRYLEGGFVAFSHSHPELTRRQSFTDDLTTFERPVHFKDLTSWDRVKWTAHADKGNPTEVLPWLYLGNAHHAEKISNLQAFGVTALLNVATAETKFKAADSLASTLSSEETSSSEAATSSALKMSSNASKKFNANNLQSTSTINAGIQSGDSCNFDSLYTTGKTFKQMCIHVRDSLTSDISQHFESAIQFIENIRQEKGKVLVHCSAGVSRSPAICLAYLMRYLSLSLERAYDFLKSRRACIAPNLNFMRQLQDFEKHCIEKETGISTDDGCNCELGSVECSVKSDSKKTCSCDGEDDSGGCEFKSGGRIEEKTAFGIVLQVGDNWGNMKKDGLILTYSENSLLMGITDKSYFCKDQIKTYSNVTDEEIPSNTDREAHSFNRQPTNLSLTCCSGPTFNVGISVDKCDSYSANVSTFKLSDESVSPYKLSDTSLIAVPDRFGTTEGSEFVADHVNVQVYRKLQSTAAQKPATLFIRKLFKNKSYKVLMRLLSQYGISLSLISKSFPSNALSPFHSPRLLNLRRKSDTDYVKLIFDILKSSSWKVSHVKHFLNSVEDHLRSLKNRSNDFEGCCSAVGQDSVESFEYFKIHSAARCHNSTSNLCTTVVASQSNFNSLDVVAQQKRCRVASPDLITGSPLTKKVRPSFISGLRSATSPNSHQFRKETSSCSQNNERVETEAILINCSDEFSHEILLQPHHSTFETTHTSAQHQNFSTSVCHQLQMHHFHAPSMPLMLHQHVQNPSHNFQQQLCLGKRKVVVSLLTPSCNQQAAFSFDPCPAPSAIGGLLPSPTLCHSPLLSPG